MIAVEPDLVRVAEFKNVLFPFLEVRRGQNGLLLRVEDLPGRCRVRAGEGDALPENAADLLVDLLTASQLEPFAWREPARRAVFAGKVGSEFRQAEVSVGEVTLVRHPESAPPATPCRDPGGTPMPRCLPSLALPSFVGGSRRHVLALGLLRVLGPALALPVVRPSHGGPNLAPLLVLE